jgi:mannitol-specific phosphotransferase system IIBC component
MGEEKNPKEKSRKTEKELEKKKHNTKGKKNKEQRGRKQKQKEESQFSQQRALSSIFAQDVSNSSPAVGKFSFFPPLHFNYIVIVAGVCGSTHACGLKPTSY